MPVTNAVLAEGSATGSLTTVYTGATGVETIIRALTVCNPTGGAVALTVVLNPAAAGTDRTLISARNVAAGATDLCPEVVNQDIGPGGLLRIQGNGLIFYASGSKFVQ